MELAYNTYTNYCGNTGVMMSLGQHELQRSSLKQKLYTKSSTYGGL